MVATASSGWSSRDSIQAAQAAGQLTVPDVGVALGAVAVVLNGLRRMHRGGPAKDDETPVNQFAESCPRVLRLHAAKAKCSAGLSLSASEPGQTPW
jgi:hypothetical protein